MLWEPLRRVSGSYDKLQEGGRIYSVRGKDVPGRGNSLSESVESQKEQVILGKMNSEI